MNLLPIYAIMSDENDFNKDYKIPFMCIVFNSSMWQTLFGMIFVTYIIYKKATKKEKTSKDMSFMYNNECPICFNIMTYPIKADCNHGYCLECLHAYWEKPSWNNLCPLCRYPIKNLQLLENGIYQYMESTKKLLLAKIHNISRTSLNMPGIYTILYYIISAAFWIVWTWNIINLDKIIQLTIFLYKTFFNDIEIESQ